MVAVQVGVLVCQFSAVYRRVSGTVMMGNGAVDAPRGEVTLIEFPWLEGEGLFGSLVGHLLREAQCDTVRG